MKKWLLILVAGLLAAGLAGGYGYDRYQRFLKTELGIPRQGVLFELEQGTSGAALVDELGRRGWTRPGWEWRLLMRLEPHVYRAGEYRLESGMTPRDVLAKLASGEVVRYQITLVEGWRFRQFAELLAANEVLEHEFDLAAPSQWPGVAAELGIEHPEGWFLPETYQFTRGDSDRDILQRSHDAMSRELETAWSERDADLPVETPYELLILASIIEKETALDHERGRIAGVFARRLKKGMRLQTDPTVIYGLGDSWDGDIRRRDLQADTPYNTYTRHGLPPTPIAMPGRASLHAAASPEPGDELYFVADGKGGHTFSATLEEHNAAVKKLLERK